MNVTSTSPMSGMNAVNNAAGLRAQTQQRAEQTAGDAERSQARTERATQTQRDTYESGAAVGSARQSQSPDARSEAASVSNRNDRNNNADDRRTTQVQNEVTGATIDVRG